MLNGPYMLNPFADEIWTASGPTVSVAGFGYPTRMVIIRLAAGGLFVWSPIEFSDQLRTDIGQLGRVAHVVAPNTLHHRFVGEWRAAYPGAQFHGAPGLTTRRPDIRFDHELGDAPAAAWLEDIDQVVVRGNRITTEVVFFHRKSRTTIFTDLIQHFDRDSFSGWRALVARLDLLTATEPTVPRKFRIAFRDRGIAREAVHRILAWPTEKLIAAHAHPIEKNGRAVVARAFDWLMR